MKRVRREGGPGYGFRKHMNDVNLHHSTPTFAADAPIADPALDRFGRWPFAERVAKILAMRQDPSSLVVGLYGAWGEGKTTVLRFIERALNSYGHVVCVWFNPWSYRDEGPLIRSFFNSLGEAIDASLGPRHEKVGPKLREYAALLAPEAHGYGGDGGHTFGEANAALELKKVRAWIGDLLQALGRRVVVFVDDMDRLEKETVQAVFRLVKLSADFDNTTYVLSFDPKVVATSLQTSGYGRTGYDFLEKIISVPLQLPPASATSLLDLSYDGVNEAVRVAEIDLTQKQVDEFVHRFRYGFLPRLQTPRIVNQYANALLFALPILKDEVHPVDQMLVEGMRIFFPGLYEHIRENPDLYLVSRKRRGKAKGGSRQAAAERERPLESLSRREREAARRLITALFPQTASGQARHDYARWDREQRVASERYFERYFQYAISTHDLPDRMIGTFLMQAEGWSEEEAHRQLVDLFEKADPKVVIRKLSLRVEEASPRAAFTLAKVVARLGSLFPDTREGVVGPAISAEAAYLVAQLLAGLPAAKRFEGARSVLGEAEPLWFALLCMSRLIGEEAREGQELLREEQEMQLVQLLAKRIRDRAHAHPFHLEEPDHALVLYSTWAAGRSLEETNAYLGQRLAGAPGEVVALLKSCVPKIWNPGSGPRLGSFERGEYEALRSIVDPETVHAALAQHYGAERVAGITSKSAKASDLSPEDRVAYQFILTHRRVERERKRAEKGRAGRDRAAAERNHAAAPDAAPQTEGASS